MRVLLDANIFISYLLGPQSDSPIVHVVDGGFSGQYVLLLPGPLLDEFAAKIRTKPYLSERITVEELARFTQVRQRIGETIPTIKQQIPAVTRDRKDDYLLAYAAVGGADYLVTGDADLLVLRQIGNVTICSPRDFVEIALNR